MLYLFNMDTPETPTNDWFIWIIMGVMLVAVIFMMVIPQRRNKKRAEEMMNKLQLGAVITTIGGIVGEVVQLDDTHIWIATGIEGDTHTMKFVRGAIHSIAPAAGTPEAIAIEKAAKQSEDEIDEIK